MNTIRLGHKAEPEKPVDIPIDSFATHYHLIGGTGKGKTTAILTLLQQLLLDPFDCDCHIIFDRLGGMSSDLLLWMASDFCTDEARRRLVYIEPANEDYVLGFNPLLYQSDGEGYYKVQRATEIILRAWESTNIEAMPRLARWTFNAFWAAAQLRLTIADCVHFLLPGSPYFNPLLAQLPPRLRFEWAELIDARGSEVVRILESTRNRLKPYFESNILRRMFGSTESRLDVGRFMREGKIVVLNLAPKGRLSGQLADTIGALILNEVFAVARSLPLDERYTTYLWLDEFQNFVGPDIESALPEVRQLALRLILSHQSLSQLVRSDHDLTNMIYQAQSRMIFGVQGPDADELAHELASITFDPMRIKEENYVRRQRLVGNEIRLLNSWTDGESEASTWNKSYGDGWTTSQNVTHGLIGDTKSDGSGRSANQGRGEGGTQGHSRTHSVGERLVPVHEDYLELANRVFSTFDEQKHGWASKVRRLKKGQCVLRRVDDDEPCTVDVERSTPGHLAWDYRTLKTEFPQALEGVARLREENFRSDLFVSPERIEREASRRLESVLQMTLPAPVAGTVHAQSPIGDPFL